MILDDELVDVLVLINTIVRQRKVLQGRIVSQAAIQDPQQLLHVCQIYEAQMLEMFVVFQHPDDCPEVRLENWAIIDRQRLKIDNPVRLSHEFHQVVQFALCVHVLQGKTLELVIVNLTELGDEVRCIIADALQHEFASVICITARLLLVLVVEVVVLSSLKWQHAQDMLLDEKILSALVVDRFLGGRMKGLVAFQDNLLYVDVSFEVMLADFGGILSV